MLIQTQFCVLIGCECPWFHFSRFHSALIPSIASFNTSLWLLLAGPTFLFASPSYEVNAAFHSRPCPDPTNFSRLGISGRPPILKVSKFFIVWRIQSAFLTFPTVAHWPKILEIRLGVKICRVIKRLISMMGLYNCHLSASSAKDILSPSHVFIDET